METGTRIIAFPDGKIQGAGDPATELPLLVDLGGLCT